MFSLIEDKTEKHWRQRDTKQAVAEGSGSKGLAEHLKGRNVIYKKINKSLIPKL